MKGRKNYCTLPCSAAEARQSTDPPWLILLSSPRSAKASSNKYFFPLRRSPALPRLFSGWMNFIRWMKWTSLTRSSWWMRTPLTRSPLSHVDDERIFPTLHPQTFHPIPRCPTPLNYYHHTLRKMCWIRFLSLTGHLHLIWLRVNLRNIVKYICWK